MIVSKPSKKGILHIMKLKLVTLTGADDSTSIAEMFDLSQEFPFVEWGILISERAMGGSRFPSADWLNMLQMWVRDGATANLSLHLCGRWLRRLLLGEDITGEFPIDVSLFDRMQLNFHADNLLMNKGDFFARLEEIEQRGVQPIFQIDGNDGGRLFSDYCSHSKDANPVPLFDLSHGAGVTPDSWPDLIGDFTHGYAGGIGPDNVTAEIVRVSRKTADCPFWIDMETKLRSQHDTIFDLDKCHDVLSHASNFVQ